MALLPWVLWATLLHHVQAAWEIAQSIGQSCTTVCAGYSGATCSQDGTRQLNNEHEFDYVYAQLFADGKAGGPSATCVDHLASETFDLPAQPAATWVGTIVGPYCYHYAKLSECGATSSEGIYRICCCLPTGVTDYYAECYVPTSTTSTATSITTTISTTSVTTITTTSVTATVTVTLTSVTSSMTSTATSVTSTQTTQTTTSMTATSMTMTGTGTDSTITTTATTVTQTTITATSTSSTATFTATTTTATSTSVTTATTTTIVTLTTTSFTTSSTSATQTTTSTTVTARATTLITETVSAGSSRIPVSDRTGFSEGDVILLRGREVVTIENITDGARRLEEYEDDSDVEVRNLAGTTAILEVTPPIEAEYNPGDLIRNLGPSSTYTGSDPITFHDGQKLKFWLPNYQEHLLLQTREIKVFGEVFPGPKPDQQWFGNFRVVLADDTPVLQVNIRPGTNHSKMKHCSSRRMDSMDVFLGRSRAPLREVQRRPMEFTAGEDVRFAIDCRQQDRPLLASSRTEYIQVETPSIGFLIVAAHAGNEFPEDWRLQLKYMHLDLLILEMPRKHEFTGILPEIWGTVPRSSAVEAMLSPPDTESAELAPTVCQDQSISRHGSPVCLS